MTIASVFAVRWVRCNMHRIEFTAIDPVWSRKGHQGCAFHDLDRLDLIVIVGEDLRGREGRDRGFCCEPCGGRGQIVYFSLDVAGGLEVNTRVRPDIPDPKGATRRPCQECHGRGWV